MQALIARGVIGDFGARPHPVRHHPLYLDEADIDRAVEILIEIMATDADTPEYRLPRPHDGSGRPSADPLDWRRGVGASTISPMANTDVLGFWKSPKPIPTISPSSIPITSR